MSFNWEYVGSTLLERERRPVLVLDLAGRVVRFNRAVHLLLDEGVQPLYAHFADQWVRPERRDAFDEAWLKALTGERVRLAVPLLPHVTALEPVFELTPLGEAGEPRSVMLVMIEATTAAPSLPLATSGGAHYEVLMNARGEPVRLLRASPAPGQRRPDTALPCYKALHGREAPCEGCPLQKLGSAPSAAGVRLESSRPFRAQLLLARRLHDDVVSISSTPVDQSLYSGLVQARVSALGEVARLTTRERGVLEHLLLGRTLEDVASSEGIKRRTAKYHQQNLLKKVGAESRVDLFRLLS